jgi:hypothetical protein
MSLYREVQDSLLKKKFDFEVIDYAEMPYNVDILSIKVKDLNSGELGSFTCFRDNINNLVRWFTYPDFRELDTEKELVKELNKAVSKYKKGLDEYIKKHSLSNTENFIREGENTLNYDIKKFPDDSDTDLLDELSDI